MIICRDKGSDIVDIAFPVFPCNILEPFTYRNAGIGNSEISFQFAEPRIIFSEINPVEGFLDLFFLIIFLYSDI